jgi:bacteriocin biosynthesis cyclodehydratase domain-containing protein
MLSLKLVRPVEDEFAAGVATTLGRVSLQAEALYRDDQSIAEVHYVEGSSTIDQVDVLLATAPDWSEFFLQDDRAHRSGLPWLPVTTSGLYVTAGPLLGPRSGPCYNCRYQRIRQNGEGLAEQDPPSSHVAAPGTLPVVAGLVTALVVAANPREVSSLARSVCFVDANLTVSTGTLIGRHECTTCRTLARERGRSESNSIIRRALTFADPTAANDRSGPPAGEGAGNA